MPVRGGKEVVVVVGAAEVVVSAAWESVVDDVVESWGTTAVVLVDSATVDELTGSTSAVVQAVSTIRNELRRTRRISKAYRPDGVVGGDRLMDPAARSE
jgi:hypothetical protein